MEFFPVIVIPAQYPYQVLNISALYFSSVNYIHSPWYFQLVQGEIASLDEVPVDEN